MDRSKQLKWRAAYRPVWKTEFPWINEVKVDGEVKGIVCSVYRECLADININIDEDLQLKRSRGKFITVPFTKFGNFYEAAKEHEFGNKGRLDHRDSTGNLLSVKVIRRIMEQRAIPAPKTTHMNYHLQLHSRSVAVKEDNIQIMPCVEGDRSVCQPEASSIARSRSFYNTESLSFTHLVYLYTLASLRHS